MGVRKVIVKIVDHTATPYLICSIISFLMLTPFFWMLLSAFKTMSETFRSPPTYIPEDFTLETLKGALGLARSGMFKAPVPMYISNSLYICLITTTIVIIAAAFTAYGLSQYGYKGSGIALGLFLFTRTLPPCPCYSLFI